MKTVILAMGNEFRGDDGIGIFLGKILEKRGFPVIFGFETPENVLNELQDFKRIIVIDAAHFEKDVPFQIQKKLDDSSYSHKLGLNKLKKFLKCDLILFGIKTYKRVFDTSIGEKARRNALASLKVIEMCMAVPGIVKDIENKLVEVNGVDKKARFALPNLKDGDFVLIHANVIIEKLSEEEYKDAFESTQCFI